jgi:hypothetical protein
MLHCGRRPRGTLRLVTLFSRFTRFKVPKVFEKVCGPRGGALGGAESHGMGKQGSVVYTVTC